ncbi:hypothetical protein B0I37DRAFT_408450 [Chaetomium sp. MPI-CAGE-AT-0009]|nr:hypothetical protein B0I37DRAFT_408450 [Chaetomium sp. MPI-CAGE-AT-0009]
MMAGCGTADNPLRMREYAYDGEPEQFLGLLLTGTPRERGTTYGLWLRDEIKANVAWHKGHPHLPSWSFCVEMAKAYYIPGLKKHWKSGWMELKGMSDGSGVPIEDLVVLNARDDLAALQVPLAERASESTSAFFSKRATADKAPILAHSWSSLGCPGSTELLVCLEIQYPAAEDKFNMFMVTEAGRISGCAMNVKGVAVTGNRLLSTDDDRIRGRADRYFPMTCFERFSLEYASVYGVRFVEEETLRHTSRHILVADKAGRSTSLELGPEHIFFHRGEFGSRATVHANHFQSFDAFSCRREMNDRYEGNYSQFRLARFNELIKRNDAGVSMQQIVGMFSDHEGRPESICEHGGNDLDNTTMAFVMFDMERRVISLCKGPPCKGVMSHFTFSKEENDGAEDEKTEHVHCGAVDPELFDAEVDKLIADAKADTSSGSDLSMPLNNSPAGEVARSPTLARVPQDLVAIAAQGVIAMDMDRNKSASPVSVLPQSPSLDRAASPSNDMLTPPDQHKIKTPSSTRDTPKRKTPPTSPLSEISSPHSVMCSASGKDLEKLESGRPAKRIKFWDPVRDSARD